MYIKFLIHIEKHVKYWYTLNHDKFLNTLYKECNKQKIVPVRVDR